MPSEPVDLVLVADDEADIHAVTKLSLKALRRPGRRLEVLGASSGKETVEMLEKHPTVAVLLLDVVMETSDAGLVACKTIREEIKNRLVRILPAPDNRGQRRRSRRSTTTTSTGTCRRPS